MWPFIIEKLKKVELWIYRSLVAITLPSIIEDALIQLNFWNNDGRFNALVKLLMLEVKGDYHATSSMHISYSKRIMITHNNNNDIEVCSLKLYF